MRQPAQILRLVTLLLAGIPAASTRADAPRPIRPDDILNIRWAASLALSPDAIQAAYLVLDPADAADPKSSPRASLWLAATDRSSPPPSLVA